MLDPKLALTTIISNQLEGLKRSPIFIHTHPDSARELAKQVANELKLKFLFRHLTNPPIYACSGVNFYVVDSETSPQALTQLYYLIAKNTYIIILAGDSSKIPDSILNKFIHVQRR